MQKSLRVQVLLRLIIGAMIVIMAYRVVAKFAVHNTIYLQTRIEMQVGLDACMETVGQRKDFVACYTRVNQRSLTAAVADDLQFCQDRSTHTGHGDIAACTEAQLGKTLWLDDPQAHTFVEWLKPLLSRYEWLGQRPSPGAQGPIMLLQTNAVERVAQQLWAVRDTHFTYVAPLIFVLLLLLGFWIIRTFLSPLESLAKSLGSLNASNFAATGVDSGNFVEFQRITTIYQDMCARLGASFDKERSFTAAAAHELRTPLTILRGTSERLIAQLAWTDTAQVLARNMGDEVERLIDISEKLLLLSRADARALVLKRQDFNLSRYLEDFAAEAQGFQSGITIAQDLAPGVVWNCDPVLVKQLIQNLYTNAVKYNRPQGHIHFQLQKSGAGFELQLTNTTAHLAPDTQARAFDRFYRGDAAHNRRVDGMGLGLSICLEIAKVHGASLTFVAESDESVTVTLQATFV